MSTLTINAVMRLKDLPHPYVDSTIVICDKCKEECWQDSRPLENVFGAESCLQQRTQSTRIPEQHEGVDLVIVLTICTACIGEATKDMKEQEAKY